MKRFLFLSCIYLIVFCCGYHKLAAQLSGTIPVPGGAYTSLDAVITALNQQGVGAGGVTIHVTADQTAPAGGYILGSSTLNNSVSALKTISFKGNGYTITAPAGTGAMDGIFTLAGVDYVTIDSLHLKESAANTTDNTKMEWGYALFKRNNAIPFDGCQHIVIRNCRIALRYSSSQLTYGIYADHRIAGATVMAVTSADPADAHADGRYRNNIITGCLDGIHLFGMNNTANYNQDQEVSGNIITFGGGASSSTAYGVFVQYTSNARITDNTISIAAGNTGSVNGIAAATGNGDLIIERNILTLTGNNTISTVTGIAQLQSYTGKGIFRCRDNVCNNWNFGSLTSGQVRAFYLNNASNAFDSILVTGNQVKNMTTGNGAHTGVVQLIYNLAGTSSSYVSVSDNIVDSITQLGTGGITSVSNSLNIGPTVLDMVNNTVTRVRTGGGTSYGVQAAFGAPVSAANITEHITGNRVENCFITGSGSFFGIHAVSAGDAASNISGNLVNNITTNTGNLTGIHCSFAQGAINGNTVSNLATGSATLYGYNNAGGQSSVFENRYDSLKTNTGTIYGHYNGTTGTSIYNNIYSNFQVQGSSGSIYGIYFSGLNGVAKIYNNIISNYRVSASYSGASNLFGIYLAVSATAALLGHYGTYNIYHNTFRIGDLVAGGDLGVSGIRYAANADGRLKVDLRNNIIHLAVTPAGAGITAAVRRDGGTAGVHSGDLLPSGNGNVYYVPDADSSFIYVEGPSAAALVNKFSLRNDPLFNTTCGMSLYKSFIGAEQSSFTENNMVPGVLPATWVPAGASYAKGLGVATSNPQVTTDFAGVSRGSAQDAGALEFTGILADVTPPSVSYTPLPEQAYCTSGVSDITATITDASGVATGAGVRPRIYYRKSSESDSFGVYPANNTSGFDGWKYTEATGNGPVFIFRLNYSLLHTPVSAGDSIIYFIVAQDSASTPNVGIQSGGLAPGYCAVSVVLDAAAGPMAATPVSSGYRILAPQFIVTPRHTQVCPGGATRLEVAPVPQGVTMRWQQDGGAGNWTDIPGANGGQFTTGALAGTTSFRLSLFTCGDNSDSIVTSAIPITVIPGPQLTSVTPGLHCGAGPVTLHADAPQGSTIRWYATAAGDTLLDTGRTFITPVLDTSRDYYVSVAGADGGEIVPSPAPSSRTLAAVWSLLASDSMTFTVYRPVTIYSVKMYPAHDAPSGTASIAVVIRNAATGSIHTGPTHQFPATSSPSGQIVPVNISLGPGTYRMKATTSGINSLSTTPGAAPPYTAPSGVLSITGSTYKYFYEWSVGSACEGPLVPVSAVIDSVVAVLTAAGPVSFCAGEHVVLHANSDTGLTYRWRRQGGDIAGASDSFYMADLQGAYTVIVSNANCSDTATPVTVNVHPLPQPAITPDGQELTTGVYDVYQWNRNGDPVPAANNRRFTPAEEGDYTVTVTDSNGCTATSPVHRIGTGIRSLQVAGRSFTLYPNPNNGSFTLRRTGAGDRFADLRIEITDVTGRVLLQEKAGMAGNTPEYPVNMPAGCTPGAYFLKVYTGQEHYVIPFVRR